MKPDIVRRYRHNPILRSEYGGSTRAGLSLRTGTALEWLSPWWRVC